jgi:hypothetical protein
VNDLDDIGTFRQKLRDRLRILHMALHAQRQRLYALQSHEGVKGRKRRAEIAEQRRARLDDVCDRPQGLHRLDPNGAVVGGVRRVQGRLAGGVFLPVEIAAVDDCATDRRAMAANIFGGRIDHAYPVC